MPTTLTDLCEVFLPESDDLTITLRRHWAPAEPSVGVFQPTLSHVEPLLGHHALCSLARVSPSDSEALYESLHELARVAA